MNADHSELFYKVNRIRCDETQILKTKIESSHFRKTQ